jgi:hypothetical protein
MKQLFFFCICLISFSAAAQKTEYTAHFNTGLFSFAGNEQDEASFSNEIYNSKPYGQKSGLSYGLGAQIQRVTESDLMIGIQAAYESLASKRRLREIIIDNVSHKVNARTILRTSFISVYPYFGNRFSVNKIPFDLSLGPDLGFGLSSKEKRKTKNPDSKTKLEHTYPGMDLRLRISLSAFYKQYGFNTGYSFGGTNYSEGIVGQNAENRSRYIRMGISYNIKPSVLRQLFR